MESQGAGATNILNRHLANPFWVLDLPPDTSAAMVERRGEMWISMLSLGLAEADHYSTPHGPRERTPELVREAMAELRDPNRRLIHEWWLWEQEPLNV